MTWTRFPPSLSQEKQDFIKAFYRVSDIPGATDEYVGFLTEGVDFIMGLKAIQGVQAVRKMRETMWGDVTSRCHSPTQVYTFGSEGNDLMIHGKAFEDVGWAARIVFAPGGDLKMKSYQASLAHAVKQMHAN
ncbi:BQ2448_3442 [Microbotryum intermedium]|uniref:BQ2448_3442 protein n=1 Tax=Microbotryum intermedium TaxID=269621 RepID=A0A238FA13_9BASI|nr:BQ2448_3442 [Microbotryum intermedium]